MSDTGINFYPGSYRAAASDLAISVSPLGLVEMSDEEFEVHGPRLNRYANNWAWFLGHHWAYKREIGDPQITLNYVRAIAEYHVNFHFGKGVQFHSPEATAAVTPYLLKTVWDEHNNRMGVIHEIAQNGVVGGDVFVKVAYEPAYMDPVGMVHGGRIRILPLNAAYCFPTWAPHDRERLIEFKLKYKFWTTSSDGTKAIATYVEVLTDSLIREYINDTLINERPNELGFIPIAYTQHKKVSSSPWGLSEIQDIIPLNRELNEKATEVSDIVNYHAAPVTVVIGARSDNLQKGPNKVWTIGNKDAKIDNLTMGENLTGPLGYLEFVKSMIHQLSGVPQGALGEMQPLTNTSAASIHTQFYPMMLINNRVKIQYDPLFKQINRMVIHYAALFEPQMMEYNPAVSGLAIKPDQYALLDPRDPATYLTSVEWPDPLPLDVQMRLLEIQGKMALGIESRTGALRDLGSSFPEQKMQEIFEEQIEDTKKQAAMELLTAKAAQVVIQATGMMPDGTPLVVPGVGQPDPETGQPTGYAPAVDNNLAYEMMAMAISGLPAARMDFQEDDE